MKTFKEYLREVSLSTKLEYHDNLNPELWSNDAILKTEVKTALNKIASEFIEFLEVRASDIKDIIITGSNCNFNWTQKSDIDLHVVMDIASPEICASCTGDFVKDCFLAKKTLWNLTHDITIYGYDVELYPQDSKDPLIASGVYSLKQDKWLIKPEHKNISYDNPSVVMKAAEIGDQIDKLIDSQSDDVAAAEALSDKIHKMRTAGLESGGEFSVEALSFKVLRNNGFIDKLRNHQKRIKDKSLSLSK